MGLIQPPLDFDPGSHRYSVGGSPYTSVTQMIGALKLSPPYPADDPRGLKDLGSAVHKAAELAMWDRLDDATTSPELLPYIAGVREKKREMNIRPIATELQLYDPLDGIAGTLDLFCSVYDGDFAVIDYKRSNSVANCTALQLAGYVRLLKRAHERGHLQHISMEFPSDIRQVRRFSMKLLDERSPTKEYTDHHDHAAWAGAIELYKWQSHRPKTFEQ